MIICPITPQVCDVHAVTGLLPIKSEPPRYWIDPMLGCLQRMSHGSQWETSALGCCVLLQRVPFTAAIPSSHSSRWASWRHWSCYICWSTEVNLTTWVSVGFLVCEIDTTDGTCVVSFVWWITNHHQVCALRRLYCKNVRGPPKISGDLIIAWCVASLKEHAYSCWEQNSSALYIYITLWNNVKQAVRRKTILRSWTAWQVCPSVTRPHIESDSVREEHMPLSCCATLPLALIY